MLFTFNPLLLSALQLCCAVFIWAACRMLARVEPASRCGRRLWWALLLAFSGIGMMSLLVGAVGLYFFI